MRESDNWLPLRSVLMLPMVFWGSSVLAQQSLLEPSPYYSCQATSCSQSGLEHSFHLGCTSPGGHAPAGYGATIVEACEQGYDNACKVPRGGTRSHYRITHFTGFVTGLLLHRANGLGVVSIDSYEEDPNNSALYDVTGTCDFESVATVENSLRSLGGVAREHRCNDLRTTFLGIKVNSEGMIVEEAGCQPADKDICIASDPGIGEPCHPGSGNKSRREVDYAPSGSDFSITRLYNSTIAHKDFGFGYGWSNGFITRSIDSTRSLDFDGVNGAFVRSASGRSARFYKAHSGAPWVAVDADNDVVLTEGAADATVSYPDGSIETYSFDGFLQSITDAAGKTTTYTYNTKGQLTTVTYPFGHTFTLTWNESGRIASITVPHGGVYEYQYDANYNLIRVTYPDSTFREYIYDDPNPGLENYLTGIIDETGSRYITYAYDPNSKKAILTQLPVTDDPQGRPQQRYQLQYAQ